MASIHTYQRKKSEQAVEAQHLSSGCDVEVEAHRAKGVVWASARRWEAA